jgi:hypothetical protein
MTWKKNSLLNGFLTGLFSPPIAFYVFCFFSFRDEKVMDVLQGYIHRNVLTHIISLSVLVNLPLFFGFLGMNHERSANGVIGATFLYAFTVLILKLL